jgi:hypothetical protein
MAAQKKSQIAPLRARRRCARPVAVARLPLRGKKADILKDESGFNTSMRRLRARAPRGKRAYGGKVPRSRGKNTTLIAAITLEGAIGESMSIEGALPTRRPSKPTLSACWHPLFVRGRW